MIEVMVETLEKYARTWRIKYAVRDRGDGVPEWHAVCFMCEQTIAVISRGTVGYHWTPGELLSLTCAHIKQAHEGVMGQ